MAPNAERLRNRKSGNDAVQADETMSTAVTTRTLDTLKGTEVCIDGVVYDIADFPHPGGESILIFGGNDVTVQYKMIHPYHTSKHLEKMKQVAIVKDYQSEYTFGSEFERELKREVFKIVPRGREFGTFGWYFRACVYITLYFYLQYLWVTKGASWQLALAYGFVKASMGLNVQHDANHGAASKTPWINHLLGLGADLIGGSKWLWMQQHWTHHAYTNHSKKDPDTHGSEPVFLFHNHPKGHPIRSFVHKFQPVYFFILASLYWVTEMFNPASWNLKHSGALNSGFRMDNDYTVSRRKYARIIRFFYILIHVVAPIMKQGLKWSVIGNILLMGGSGSVILAVLFAISHNFEGADRDPTHMLDTKKGDVEKTPVDWYKAQVETSSSYGGFISGYLTGGLNFQVEHHLFPRMSSSWYPYIAPVVRDVCRKHNVKYVYFPWVFQNIVSSVKYLYQSGTGEYKMESPYSGKL